MPEKPKILKQNLIAESRLFRIEQMDLEFSNGERRKYERLVSSGHGAVLIVPLLDDDTVLMIREYSAGVHRYELTMPKGRLEPGETIEDAANREIMEEIGHGARKLHNLTSLTLAPGYLGHHTHIVLAEDLYEKSLPGDEPETLEVVPWRLSKLDELLHRADCTEARTLAALFIVREHLRIRRQNEI